VGKAELAVTRVVWTRRLTSFERLEDLIGSGLHYLLVGYGSILRTAAFYEVSGTLWNKTPAHSPKYQWPTGCR